MSNGSGWPSVHSGPDRHHCPKLFLDVQLWGSAVEHSLYMFSSINLEFHRDFGGCLLWV